MPKAYGPSYVIEARGADTVHIGISHITDEQAARLIRLLPQIISDIESHTPDTRERIEAIEQRADQLNLIVTRPRGLRRDRNDPEPLLTLTDIQDCFIERTSRGDAASNMVTSRLDIGIVNGHVEVVAAKLDPAADQFYGSIKAEVERPNASSTRNALKWVDVSSMVRFATLDGINYKVSKCESGGGANLTVTWLYGPPVPWGETASFFDPNTAGVEWFMTEDEAKSIALRIAQARGQQLDAEAQCG